MRTSVFFFVYKILLSIYAQIYNSSPTYRGRRILAIYYVKAVWQNTKGNEGQEPAALQLSSCPVHLEYRISKNKLSGHHTE